MRFVFLLAAAAWAAPADIPEDLKPVLTRLRRSVPGAELSKLYATVGTDGRARCPEGRTGGRYESWAVVLQPPSGRPWMAVECGPEAPRQAYMDALPPIRGGFIGIDQALAAVRASGVRWAPGTDIRAELSQPRGPPEVSPLWRLSALGRVFLVDGRTAKVLKAGTAKASGPIGAAVNEPGGSMEETLNGELEQLKASLEQSPVGAPLRRHLPRVLALVRRQRPRAALMAVEGATDGGGRSLCAPPFNGWTYTVYDFERKEYAFYQECAGKVGPRSRLRLPVDFRTFVPLPEKFIDSSDASALASKNASHIMLLVHKKADKCPLAWHLNQPAPFKSGEEAYLRSYAGGSDLILDANEKPSAAAARDPRWRYRCGGKVRVEKGEGMLDGVKVAPVQIRR